MNIKNIRSATAIAVSGLVLSSIMPLAAMAAVPTINSISPSFAMVGSSALTLTVNGNYFDHNAVVYFNGNARATTYISPTQVTAVIPASDLNATGTFGVTVNNPSAGGGTSNAQVLSVIGTNNPIPALTSISPTSVVAGSGAFTMNVYGVNFNANSQVRFNGLARATTYVSSGQLMAVIPTSDVAATGTHAVDVVNQTPGGGASNALLFTAAPVSITPGLPNTGFGPGDDQAAGNAGLIALGIVMAGLLLAAFGAQRRWVGK